VFNDHEAWGVAQLRKRTRMKISRIQRVAVMEFGDLKGVIGGGGDFCPIQLIERAAGYRACSRIGSWSSTGCEFRGKNRKRGQGGEVRVVNAPRPSSLE